MKDPIEDIDFLYKIRKDWNFFIDEEIFSFPQYSQKNIGYLLEAKSIKPWIYNEFIATPALWERFELILTHDRSILELNDRMRYAPMGMTWIKNPKIKNKNKLVSMITSNKLMCDGHRYRMDWSNRLKGKLDLYGRGINPIDNKEEALDDYMFSVAIENGNYSGYFTEKLIDCFATGTIPIYYGDPDIGQIFDTDGIITLNEGFDIDSLTPELYYSMMPSIQRNFEISKSYWSLQDYIQKNHLSLMENK